MHNWAENYWLAEDDECPNRERALLVRGVPLAGERVVLGRDIERVVSHAIYVVVWQDNGQIRCLVHPDSLRPAPYREEEEVEAVARALAEKADEWPFWCDEARAAIAALDEVRGADR